MNILYLYSFNGCNFIIEPGDCNRYFGNISSNKILHIVSKVEKDIKAIRGVVTFKLKEKAHDVKTWTIS